VRLAVLTFLVLGVLTLGTAIDWSTPTTIEVPAIELRPAPLVEVTGAAPSTPKPRASSRQRDNGATPKVQSKKPATSASSASDTPISTPGADADPEPEGLTQPDAPSPSTDPTVKGKSAPKPPGTDTAGDKPPTTPPTPPTPPAPTPPPSDPPAPPSDPPAPPSDPPAPPSDPPSPPQDPTGAAPAPILPPAPADDDGDGDDDDNDSSGDDDSSSDDDSGSDDNSNDDDGDDSGDDG
jgi:hypothetical protein